MIGTCTAVDENTSPVGSIIVFDIINQEREENIVLPKLKEHFSHPEKGIVSAIGSVSGLLAVSFGLKVLSIYLYYLLSFF